MKKTGIVYAVEIRWVEFESPDDVFEFRDLESAYELGANLKNCLRNTDYYEIYIEKCNYDTGEGEYIDSYTKD